MSILLLRYILSANTNSALEIITRKLDVRFLQDASLRLAAWFGYADIVVSLLSAGADVHARNDEPVFNAVAKNHLGVAAILKSKGGKLRKDEPRTNWDQVVAARDQYEKTFLAYTQAKQQMYGIPAAWAEWIRAMRNLETVEELAGE